MKKYRLHDVLRAAAAAWMATACGAATQPPVQDAAKDAQADAAADAGPGSDAPPAPDGKADAVSDTATADALADVQADAGSDAGPDATPDVGPDAAADAPSTDAAVKDAAADAPGDAAADAGKASPFPCLDSKPLVVQGKDTGYAVCANGMVHRPKVAACPPYQPDPNKVCPNPGNPGPGQCNTDADCEGQAKGSHCEPGMGMPSCYCAPSCQTDADCGAGQLCVCGEKYGTCVPTVGCSSDADCKEGVCGSYVSNPGCDFPGMTCQTFADECAVKADCKPDQQCTYEASTGHRFCSGMMCAIGRPFAVDGQWRSAPAETRADWLGESADLVAALDLSGLPSDLRQRLARYWLEAARMEHASVASFARLTLELMAVGAPPELLARAQQAGLDEVRHAGVCFGIAAALSGQPQGPGNLHIAGALRAPRLADIAAAAASEGCVWETCAALEARVAAAEAHDPVLGRLLGKIADDEAQHAELAWDIVRWAVATGGPEVRTAVVDALDAAVADLYSAAVAAELPQGCGVLSGSRLQALRRHALAAVIAPSRARAGLVAATQASA